MPLLRMNIYVLWKFQIIRRFLDKEVFSYSGLGRKYKGLFFAEKTLPLINILGQN